MIVICKRIAKTLWNVTVRHLRGRRWGEVVPLMVYWQAPNYREELNLSDVALFRALQTQICEICIQSPLLHETLKPHRKNGQITANNKLSQYKMCALPIPRPNARAGEVKYFKN